eukprot:TRINITY_DN8942_c0_g2_i1.p1 TRINITY_DN8942_c0_g2~~TRINITY_DN8942_c0_g2_i1.p1  ORF type:complete len:226 (-),score=45.66 TRINITY_DN8942_c0_g2_i1:458-1078(-)
MSTEGYTAQMYQSVDDASYLTQDLLEAFERSLQQPYHLNEDLLEAFDRSSLQPYHLTKDLLDAFQRSIGAAAASRAPEVTDGTKDDASDSSSTIVNVWGKNLGKALEEIPTCDSLPMAGVEQPSDHVEKDSEGSSSSAVNSRGSDEVAKDSDDMEDSLSSAVNIRGMKSSQRLVKGSRKGFIGWTRPCTPECPCNELPDSLKYIIH